MAAASAEQAEQIGRIDDRLQRVNARIEEIDQRITSISTELANQLTELSTELDAIHSAQPPDGETVDELRDSQTRLAEEQARYQIAFRKDLAELADRLKRA
ncbi:MAG: hypothetical protein HKN41_10560 [Ilumatobacter sp.]|nr:hypothetical protein [Ilumatobacter sp.]